MDSVSAIRLTPAQKRGLALLATPGAEARNGRLIRWSVRADGVEIGSIHSESLLALRCADLVEMYRGDGDHPLGFRQRLTERGRAYLASVQKGGG